jgi:hypothetical protein
VEVVVEPQHLLQFSEVEVEEVVEGEVEHQHL